MAMCWLKLSNQYKQMKLSTKINKYLDQFEASTRDNGESYTHLKKLDFESDLYNAISEAHGDRLPSDWIYETFRRCLQSLSEYDIKSIDDLDEYRHEAVDGLVDVYTSDLTAWLNDSVYNVAYLDDIVSEYEPKDGASLLSMAQYKAIDEVMDSVINLISK